MKLILTTFLFTIGFSHTVISQEMGFIIKCPGKFYDVEAPTPLNLEDARMNLKYPFQN